MNTLFYATLWLTVNITLCLLFWLLAFQNRAEKNLLFIALTTRLLTLVIFCEVYSDPDSSFLVYRAAVLALPIVRAVAMITALLLMLRIFKRKITLLFKIAASALFIGGICQLFFHTSVIIAFQGSLILLIYAYYIITSWKILKGAQWAIVAGILLAVSLGVLLGTCASVSPELNYSLLFLYSSGLFLSYPLSLLVYVAIRFKEIINEVQQNAKQVVQLSEEKREQAINRQKILQEEVNRQTAEIRTTLDDLKSTQSQLIQSEKMASLGELTAGIAHEIQNPLNFVNNFSEVNNELLVEMKDELAKGNLDLAKSLADDIMGNQSKINHHGR